MSIELRIACDGCGARHIWDTNEVSKAHVIRGQLKTNLGWKTGERGGKDYCPNCCKSFRKSKIA